MRMRAFSVLLTMTVAFAGVAGAQPLADKLPADTVLYVGWQGTNAPAAGYAGSHLQAVLQASNFPQLVDEFIPRVGALVMQKDKQFAKVMPLISVTVKTLWKYPSALYVGPLDMGGGQPMPKLAIVSNAGGDAEGAVKIISDFVAMAGGDAPPLTVQAKGGLVVVAFGNAVPASLAGSLAGNGNLANDAEFKAALAQTVKDPVIAVYVKLSEVWATIDKFAPPAQPGEPSWPQIRDALSLTGVKSLAIAEGFDGKDWAGAAFVSAPSPRAGLLKALEGVAVDDAFLKYVPKASLMMIAGRFRPTAILDAVRTVWPMLPKGAPPIDDVLQQGSGILGFDIEKDFFASFGDEWAIYTDASVGGTGMAGTALVHRPANAAKLEQAMGMIEQFANNMIAANLKKEEITVAFKTQQVGGLKLHYLALPAVTPTWTVKDGLLIVGLYPQTVIGAVGASTGGGPSILENGAFVATRKRLGDVKATSIQFQDLPKIVPQTYGSWVAISRMVGVGDLFGIDSPLMLVPPMKTIEEHIAPAGAVSWVDDGGFHTRALSAFPGSAVLSTDPVQAYLNASPAFMLSVMLPALSKARETANRVKDASNLRVIGQGCMLYANESHGKYPPDLGTIAKTQDIAPQVFTSPLNAEPKHPIDGTGDEIAAWVTANSDYEYHGAGQSVAKLGANTPIAWDKPELSQSRGGLNILFGDGRVEWMSLGEAQNILNKGN